MCRPARCSGSCVSGCGRIADRARWLRFRWPESARRLVLAARYAVAAAALAIAGIALGGAALWLLWPAVSLALVAANYAVFGAGGFQKGPDGRMSLAALALFLPYLIGAWINSRLWTRHDDEAAAVGDDVFIGRNPWPRAAREFAAIVDLCAELPGSRRVANNTAARSRRTDARVAAPRPRRRSSRRERRVLCWFAALSAMGAARLRWPPGWWRRGAQEASRRRSIGFAAPDLGSSSIATRRRRWRRRHALHDGGADTVERDLAAAAAALLDQGQRADRLSRLITAAGDLHAAAAGVSGAPPPVLPTTIPVLVVLLGLVELYLAIRVGFDAALFHRLAAAPEGFDCARLDRALLRLGLMPEAKTGRPIVERIAGARRLLAWQGLTLAAQVLLVLVGAALSASLARSGG